MDFSGLQQDPNDEEEVSFHQIQQIPLTPHQCNICQKTFTSYKGLQQHYVIHTDERPFKCEVCSQSFRFKSNLFEHSSVHTGFTPYKCSYCDKTCRLKGNLKKHLRTHVTNKEELEAAWRPFAKQDPSRRRSAPYQSLAPRRQPLSNVRDGNGFATPSTSSYRMPRRNSRTNGVGDSAHWVKLIKGGMILPQVDLEQKMQRFEHNVFTQTQPFTTWAELIEMAKTIAFETHTCPVCHVSFMNRDDCDGHCQMSHPNMRNASNFFCDKCFRLFNDEDSFQQHIKYHLMVNNLLENGSITIETADMIEPEDEELEQVLGLAPKLDDLGLFQQDAFY